MDLLCDNLVEAILYRVPAKYLHRVRAVARRYNLIVLSAGFDDRYWKAHSANLSVSGVFIQSDRPWRQRSRFLDASTRPCETESMFAADLAFFPPPSPGPAARSREIFIVHATGGLVLCSRGKNMAVQYYVCNPVTLHWVALPKLPWRPLTYMSGLLSVTNTAAGDASSSFQVVLFNPPPYQFGGSFLDLMVFSSATGSWEKKPIEPPIPILVVTHAPPFVGQSGTAYWIGYSPMDSVIAYNSLHHTIKFLAVPSRVHGTTRTLNRCIGERQGGGLRYAHFDCWVLRVWDLQAGGVDDADAEWELAHQVGVMELAQRNPEATDIITKRKYVECRIRANTLFSVLGFHPTADIIFLDVNGTVLAYSIEDGTTRYQCSHNYLHHHMFPYVHPAHPVEIPAIKKAPLDLKPS
ncbi:uncharacterized protein [Lolium perenne]|uniref:uncharacterized protein n=1 Tax=Lolium perenne TaxID=4522 RepID=UPI003A9A14AA